jgi:hypothetical protein
VHERLIRSWFEVTRLSPSTRILIFVYFSLGKDRPKHNPNPEMKLNIESLKCRYSI